MKKLKVMIGRILFIILMVFIILAFILYKQGYYDISFIPRESEEVMSDNYTVTSSGETYISDTESPVADNIETEQPVNNETAPNQTQDSNIDIYKEAVSKIDDSKNYLTNGWSVTENVYKNNSHKIVSFKLPLEIENKYSYRNILIEEEIYNEETSGKETVQLSSTLPVIRSYMGFLIINNPDGTNSIYNPIKNIINRNLSGLYTAGIRDTSGNPVFIYDSNYHIIGTDNRMYPVDIDLAFVPGLHGNYPGNYGTVNSGLYIFFEERTVSRLINAQQVEAAAERGQYIEPIYVDEKSRLYGYKNEKGTIVIPAKYYYAYNFSDNGLAVVADRNRAISVINIYGNIIINVQNQTLRIPELSSRTIYDGYYLPNEFSMNKRGMLYFDNGLLRIRRAITDYNTLESVLRENDVLVKPDGTVFEIPVGYEIVYYSDGVAVLKNGDYYGCFSNQSKWIAQPIYTYAGMFNEGLAVLGMGNGKKGVIDTKGTVVIPFVFDEISDISGGIIAAYEESNGWSIYMKITKGEG